MSYEPRFFSVLVPVHQSRVQRLELFGWCYLYCGCLGNRIKTLTLLIFMAGLSGCVSWQGSPSILFPTSDQDARSEAVDSEDLRSEDSALSSPQPSPGLPPPGASSEPFVDGDLLSRPSSRDDVPPGLWSPGKRQIHSYQQAIYGYISELERRLAEARQHYEASYALSPNAYTGSRMIAMRYLSGDRGGSLREAQKMVLHYPRSGQIHLLYAANLLSAGQPDKALEQLREALKYSGDHRRARALLCEILMMQSRYDEAVEVASDMTRLHRSFALGWMLLIKAQLRGGELGDHEPRGTGALSSDSGRGGEVMGPGPGPQVDAALEQEHVTQKPGSAEGITPVFISPSIKMALETTVQASYVFPGHQPVMLARAYLLARMGDYSAAAEEYQRLHRKIGYEYDMMVPLISLYEEWEGYDQALETLAAVADHLGDSPQALAINGERVWIWLHQKSWSRALALAEELHERFPGDDQVQYLLGLAYQLAGQLEKAQKIWAALPPGSAFYVRGMLQAARIAVEIRNDHKSGDKDQANSESALSGAELVEKILQHSGRREDFEFAVWFYRSQQQYDHALRVLKRAQTQYPEEVKWSMLWAYLHYDTGEYGQMKQVLRKILEQHDDAHEALNFLGYFYAERGENLQKAQELIIRALELKPLQPEYLDSLGWVLFQKGKYIDSEYYLQMALQFQPGDRKIAEHLAEVMIKRGNCQRALALLRVILGHESTSQEERRRIHGRLRVLTSPGGECADDEGR